MLKIIILYGIVNFITFIVVHACIEMYDSLWKLELQAVELVGYIVDGMVEVYLEKRISILLVVVPIVRHCLGGFYMISKTEGFCVEFRAKKGFY